MAIAQIPNQGNGAVDFLSEIFKNANTLFGSGETKTETKDSADPAAMANSNQLLQKLMAGNNPADMDAMIQGILDQAKRSFGPNIAQSIGAGNRALTDTTLATIQGQAQGTATAEAAKAKLDAVAKNNQIMAQIVSNQMDSSRTRTMTQKTSASPTGKLTAAAGLGGVLYSGAKKLLNKNQVGAPVETGVSVPGTSSSVTSGLDFSGGGGRSTGFGYDTDMSPFIGDGSKGFDANSLFDFTGSSANDVLSSFSNYGSNLFGGSGVGSMAGGAFDEFGNALDVSKFPDLADVGTDFWADSAFTDTASSIGANTVASTFSPKNILPYAGSIMDAVHGDYLSAGLSAAGEYFGGPFGAFIGQQMGAPQMPFSLNFGDAVHLVNPAGGYY